MDIELKQKIAEKIIQSEDDNLLNEIKSLLDLSEEDYWDTLPEELQQGINEAKAELERGEGIPHAEV